MKQNMIMREKMFVCHVTQLRQFSSDSLFQEKVSVLERVHFKSKMGLSPKSYSLYRVRFSDSASVLWNLSSL